MAIERWPQASYDYLKMASLTITCDQTIVGRLSFKFLPAAIVFPARLRLAKWVARSQWYLGQDLVVSLFGVAVLIFCVVPRYSSFLGTLSRPLIGPRARALAHTFASSNTNLSVAAIGFASPEYAIVNVSLQ